MPGQLYSSGKRYVNISDPYYGTWTDKVHIFCENSQEADQEAELERNFVQTSRPQDISASYFLLYLPRRSFNMNAC